MPIADAEYGEIQVFDQIDSFREHVSVKRVYYSGFRSTYDNSVCVLTNLIASVKVSELDSGELAELFNGLK